MQIPEKSSLKKLVRYLETIASKMRNDMFAVYRAPLEGGRATYTPVRRSVTIVDLEHHISGEQPIGLYVFPADIGLKGLTNVAVVDIDDKEKEYSFEQLSEISHTVSAELEKVALLPWACSSGSGHGVHLWLFWELPQNATAIRRILKKITKKVIDDKLHVDIFPRQDKTLEGKPGNLVALPFSRRSRPFISLKGGTVQEDLREWLPVSPPISAALSADIITNDELKVDAGRGNVPADAYGPVDQDQLKDALQSVPADDYDIWLDVGFALKDAVQKGLIPDEDAENIRDDWSKKSEKYNEIAQKRWWHTQKSDGRITLGTIFHLAQAHGWENRQSTSKKKEHIDFHALKGRVEELSPDSVPDDISSVLEDLGKADPVTQQLLLQAIKKQTKIPLRELRRALAFYDDSADPDHLSLARMVLDTIGKENLLSTIAHVWRWRNEGVWRTIPDRELKQYVQNVLEDKGHNVTRGLVDAVAEVLKTEIYAEEHEWNSHHDVINFNNGELHRIEDGWQLFPHNRERYGTTQIPHAYDPEAKCSRFELFLQEIFSGDDDSADKTCLVLELLGYTLASNTRFEVFVLLVGLGANGKSVLLDVIRVMVGAGNVAAVQPSQFNNRFQRAHLHLKLANLVTETAEGEEIAEAELKAISSGELTTAEEKHKPPFNFNPICTCWFGTNHMPHTRDFSDALFRRAIVIPFNRKFKYGEDADERLKEKLAKEIPGIINLALHAYGEVLKRGKFTLPDSCIQARTTWRVEADQAAQFFNEKCEFSQGEKITSNELYTHYKRWAEEAGINRRLNRTNFTNRILGIGGSKDRGTGGVRMIAGVKLRDTPEEPKWE